MASSANVLTNLIPTLYLALDTVSRELVGFIPAVTRDSSLARAAIGQTVRSFVAPAATAFTIVPDQIRTDTGNQTFTNVSLGITSSRACPVRWQGEESLQMNAPGGSGVQRMMVDQFAQAMRTLVNEIEADLAGLYVNASRAVVPDASTLFSATLKDAANVRKILSDNGSPLTDLQMVVGTSEGAALRSLAQLNQVNTSGDTNLLRQGVLGNIMGFDIRESAAVKTPAVGTLGGSPIVNASAYAVGDVTITLGAGGTGTIVAGDLITYATNTAYQYVNKTLVTPTAASVPMVLNAPGLMYAIGSSTGPALVKRATGTRNLAFARSAIVLATRLPALPSGGDSAVDRTTITDPRSGLSFDVAHYLEYHQSAFEISIAWGVKAVKEEHIAILAGA